MKFRFDVHEWGYKKQNKTISELILTIRSPSTDNVTVRRVLLRNIYQRKKIGFFIKPGDHWLDLGANIGAFSLLVLSLGAKVTALEPEPENFEMVVNNLSKNFDENYEALQIAISTEDKIQEFFILNDQYNQFRHSLIEPPDSSRIEVGTMSLKSILEYEPNINCIKMDIEGMEIPILESLDIQRDLKCIRKLVFEYHFHIDRSIPRFLKIIEKLEQHFKVVHFTNIKKDELEYNQHFPTWTTVFCKK